MVEHSTDNREAACSSHASWTKFYCGVRVVPFSDEKKASEWRKRHLLEKRLYDAERNQRPEVKAIRTIRRGERRKKLRAWFCDLKASLGCMRCPERHPYCLDFHHWDANEKVFELSDAISSQASMGAIQKEISKCDLICSNCHRKEHWKWNE